MGRTYCSIHVWSTEPVANGDFHFQSFSSGWQTYLPECDDFSDPEVAQKIARKISKSTQAPVLWFYEADGDFLCLKFYLDGKQFASYSGDGIGPNKNLFQIPQLIGYEEGQKRRFSRILNCSDPELQIPLLEEFFGVCLLPVPEWPEEDAPSVSRTRGDSRFREFAEAEKLLMGKHAPVRAEIVQELEGILRDADWEYQWFPESPKGPLPHFRTHYYLLSKARATDGESVPVCFRNGKIERISPEEMRREGADQPYLHRWIGEDPRYRQEFCPDRLVFADTAPAAYAGREMRLPGGFYGLGFDGKERLVLHDDRQTFAIVDENLKIVAKQRLKGDIRDIDGDYILTAAEKGITGTIRVYRIVDGKNTNHSAMGGI